MLSKHFRYFLLTVCISSCLLACGNPEVTSSASSTDIISADDNSVPSASEPKGSRDNSVNCLVPSAPGNTTIGNDTVTIDTSNIADGYISVTYKGDAERTRLMVTTPESNTYTYDLYKGVTDTFPLTESTGNYNVGVYELISGNDYSVLFNDDVSVNSIDEYKPYLYPNQYVKFDKDTKAVTFASELVAPANNDLEAVQYVYNYVINNITYDYGKAENVESTYIPDVDNVLATKTGICFDYASLMASMLRSQQIPTRLEIGYAGEAYHAWISTYIKDIGWVNGIIEFNGKDWELMDPTFASNMSEKKLKSFIGEGDNYITKYMY